MPPNNKLDINVSKICSRVAYSNVFLTENEKWFFLFHHPHLPAVLAIRGTIGTPDEDRLVSIATFLLRWGWQRQLSSPLLSQAQCALHPIPGADGLRLREKNRENRSYSPVVPAHDPRT